MPALMLNSALVAVIGAADIMAADTADTADTAAIVTTVVHTECVSNTGTLAMATCTKGGFGGHTANPDIPLKKGARADFALIESV